MFSIFILATATGCGPQVKNLSYEQLSDNDLVAHVGDITYTKGELEHDIMIIEKLSMLVGNGSREVEDTRNTAKFRQHITDSFVNRAILLREAKRRGIGLTADDMHIYQNAFLKNFFNQQKGLDYNGLISALGPASSHFHKNLKNDALSARIEQILMQELAASLPEPSAADIEKSRTGILDFNAKIDDLNRSLMRLATNSWKSIRAGNNFYAVGRKLAEIREEITFDADYVDSSGRLANAPINLTLPPSAAEDGFEIIKITRTPQRTRMIGRIFFKPQKRRPYPSHQETANSMRKNAIDAALSKWFQSQRTKTDIQTIRFTD